MHGVLTDASTFVLQQFLYVELTALQEELDKLRTHRSSRTCRDVLMEQPTAASGNFNIDPNLGSPVDAVKTFCVFDGPLLKTCVDNSTSDSQLKHLHLLHTQVAQSIHLPCAMQGPFRSASFPDSPFSSTHV